MEDAVRVQVAADEALARALQAAGLDSNPGCSTEDDTWVIVGHSSLPSLTPPPTLTGVGGDSGSRAVAEKRKKKRKRTKSLPASSATQLLPRIRNTSLSVANYKLAKPLKYDPDLELLFSAPHSSQFAILLPAAGSFISGPLCCIFSLSAVGPNVFQPECLSVFVSHPLTMSTTWEMTCHRNVSFDLENNTYHEYPRERRFSNRNYFLQRVAKRFEGSFWNVS